jgi:predicted site-specific integrase-resolvase
MPTTEIRTVAEVAKRLGVSVRTVTRWTASGRLTAVRQSPWLYEETEVQRLADEIAAELAERIAGLAAAS